jgi:hypothetical protein
MMGGNSSLLSGSLLIKWIALYALANMWRRGETEKHMCSFASSHRAGQGRAWRGLARRWARAHDVHVNSPSKSSPKPRMPAASFCHLFLLLSLCLIHFDRDRPSRLRDDVTLGRSSRYIRAAVTEIAIYQQPRKHQHI